ncbi:uncharacterized protein [Coffea arabica]|uniref:Bromo domain-containing protein n=1 Tax=Coffea arabica TaxID=13443 RepID=A0A6P6T2W8_COFAR|nr:uncharacterized protein LOC113697034 [Coffea arabica]
MAGPNGATGDCGNKSEAPAERLDSDDAAHWGTWEDLLLVCAVNRYGTNSWESVALEIQKRSTSPFLSLSLTPRNCQMKYLDLTRRFLLKHDPRNTDNDYKDDDVEAADHDGSIISTNGSVPLLEELRKLRVAELRRELERYDLSIVTLQSKVKKMKEERERCSTESEIREEKASVLRKSEEAEAPPERDASEDKVKVIMDELEKSPSSMANKKDEQSVNGSVPKDGRVGDIEAGRDEVKVKEPGRIGEGNEEPVRTMEDKLVKEEDSGYGSSDSVEREYRKPGPESVPNEVKVEPESVSHSPELVESVAESKDGGGGGVCGDEEATTKECNSDVQSSATKSRRDGENDDVLPGSTKNLDLQNDNRSPSVKLEASVESQPLIDFLDHVKGHKLGSLFLRRLDSQEAPNYKSLIRQHVDLETVQRRVKEGIYSESNLKFFRDLLLLVNNAMVFFGKNTPEFLAAMELRHLIANEMARRNAKSSGSSSEKQASLQKASLPDKGSSEPSESLLRKPKLGGQLIVCRKRSSIAAKASASSSASDKKRDQNKMPTEDSAGLDSKHPSRRQLPARAEEPRITKKRSADRFASVSTSLKKNAKKGTGTNSKQMSGTNLEKNKGKGGSSSQQPDPRCESKNNQSSADLKKRSAANFLNRMKQSSSSNNSTLLDALKGSPLTASNNSRGGSELKKNENSKASGGSNLKKNEHGKGSGGSEHKKNENVKWSGKKAQVSTRSSDAKQAKEKSIPATKSLGRPLNKGAAPPTPSGKRGRDDRESESTASKQQRKKPRK